jgi:hypothetical protein
LSIFISAGSAPEVSAKQQTNHLEITDGQIHKSLARLYFNLLKSAVFQMEKIPPFKLAFTSINCLSPEVDSQVSLGE